MIVKLLHNSPISLIAHAARTSKDSFHKMDSVGDELGPNDKKLIWQRILNEDKADGEPKHDSVLEHVNYTFFIEGFSIGVLGQLTKHRMSSQTAKSTRYTLNQLKAMTLEDIKNSFVKTGVDEVDAVTVRHILDVQHLKNLGHKNDDARYALPPAYKTNVTITINARSLRNLLFLRTHRHAMSEFRDLALTMALELPLNHRFMFREVVW
jgi:thymidylate synthase (FAD)